MATPTMKNENKIRKWAIAFTLSHGIGSLVSLLDFLVKGSNIYPYIMVCNEIMQFKFCQMNIVIITWLLKPELLFLDLPGNNLVI